MKKNSQEKIPYLSEGELYSIWKYLNGFRLVDRGGVLNFDDLTPYKETSLFMAKFLSLLKELGIDSLEGLVFHKNIYFQYHKKGYEELKKKKEEGTLNGFALKHLEFLEEIFENPKILYRNEFGFFDSVLYEGNLGFMEFFEFSAKIPPKEKKKIENFIKKYIETFISDKLQKSKENFYCFSEQRKQLLNPLFHKEKKYGRSFIFNPLDLDFNLFKPDEEFLFIHTLIALEILGYFEVENIWIYDWDLSPEEQTEGYKVKINLKDKFFDEVEEICFGKRIAKPIQQVENKDFSNPIFSEEKGLLEVNRKKIKVKKFSDQFHLLKIIFENKENLKKEWFFSEIAEIYEPLNPPMDKKFYNATDQIRKKIAIETGIKDFFITTRQSLRINTNYLS